MNSANTARIVITKAILWLAVGIATAVAMARYLRGLGATTALTDGTPWGIWIGFDVLSGVALAAGGFVLAATVHVFRLERYHPLVRAAVLTAFLGYVAVALGLMVDLGRPWNIWRMIFFWQPHSPLFEVGWCVMLYLTVLLLEFLPVVFEGLKLSRAYAFMRRLTLPLVIAGIALSTLHQSSLGTLFLLTEDRMHPLWYSPILPLIFFVSAVAIGLAMVTTESSLTSWLYHRAGEWELLRGLTRAAAVVLGLYLVIRLGDLAWRDQLHHLVEGGWAATLFLVELSMSAVIPLLLFTLPATRNTRWAITTGAVLSVSGFVLHRADVGGIAQMPVTGELYLPALTELLISIGLVSAMALIFLFFVERLPVWEEGPTLPDHFSKALQDPVSRARFGERWFGRVHVGGVAWVLGVILGTIVLEVLTAGGEAPRQVRVNPARVAAAVRVDADQPMRSHLRLTAEPTSPDALPEGFTSALLIDGDSRGRTVLFDHLDHQRRLGGEGSCGRCHHLNLQLERATPCSVCHRDMYSCTDTFDHASHVAALHGNEGCVRCHRDPTAAKTRAASTDCRECHKPHPGALAGSYELASDAYPREAAASCTECHDRWARTTFNEAPAPEAVRGIAPGYRRAMHRLCIRCHREHELITAVAEPHLTRCATCHRSTRESLQAAAVTETPQQRPPAPAEVM